MERKTTLSSVCVCIHDYPTGHDVAGRSQRGSADEALLHARSVRRRQVGRQIGEDMRKSWKELNKTSDFATCDHFRKLFFKDNSFFVKCEADSIASTLYFIE